MDRNTKISIISVCMDKKLAKQLFNLWVTMLQEKFDKTEVQMDTNVQSVVKLKEKIVFFTDVNTTDAILIFGAQSLKNSIIEEIDKVSGAKTAIAQLFADIPVLLEPNFTTKFLYHAYHKNTLIFSVFGDESDIITAAKSAESIALATYLLRNIITRCNMSNYLSQGKNQIMSSSCSDQSSAPKGEEKEEMSTSPTSTSDKNIQTTDEANASAFTYQPIRLITGEDALQIIYVIIISAKRIPVQIETVNIKDALGRRLLEDQTCYSNVPSFSVATKNGYAVIADIEMRKMKRISKESNKINSIILDPVTTKWVNSGEFIPLGATAVIPEDNVAISTDDKGNEIKTTSHAIKYGQNIKFPGSDIEKEEVIVRSKTRIGSMEMGLLIACGYTNVNVLKEVTIGVLTIRDKSQKPGGPLRPEHSYESNRAILISLLKENGFNSADFEITTNRKPSISFRNRAFISFTSS
nr:PREDICTED: uncharacterized protein LOC105678343 isoform X2 [Linepithema humile]